MPSLRRDMDAAVEVPREVVDVDVAPDDQAGYEASDEASNDVFSQATTLVGLSASVSATRHQTIALGNRIQSD
jgi:hypothetical protein